MMLLLSTILLVTLCVHGGTAQLSFEDKYALWATDLRPGFIIKISQLGNRRCYCKVPGNNTISTTLPPSPGPTTLIPGDGGCDPSCNETYVIGPAQVGTTLSWASLGWTEGNDYPAGCTCVLNVEVVGNTTVWVELNSLANISCPYDLDSLKLAGDISTSKLCGDDIGGTLGHLTNTAPGSSSFTATFITGPRPTSGGDNETAPGFNLNLIVAGPVVITTPRSSRGPTIATTPSPPPTAECSYKCNKTITIDSNYDGETFDWHSLGWDEGLNYPDNCLCILTVEVNTPAIITSTFNSSSVIAGIPTQCLHDALYYTDLIGNGTSVPLWDTDYCGSLSYLTTIVTNPGPDDLIFEIIFNATDTDGGITDVGFNLMLTAILLTSTTVPIPTTTPLLATCDPSCNETIVVDNNWSGDLDWNSPGWDDGLNYPDNCICILTVVVLESATVTTSFNFSSVIVGTPANCIHDNIEYTGDITAGPFCGSLSYLEQSVTNIQPGNKTFQVTFTSTDEDGEDTDVGFSLIISALILTTTTAIPTTTTEIIAECLPSCSQTVLIDDDWMGQEFIWNSPGWDQGVNYPDNCICTLTVDITATATVTTTFNLTSMLTGTPGACTGDYLIYEGAINSPEYCGTLSYLTQSVNNMFPENKTFTITFNSSDIDPTDVGFSLMLTAVVFSTTTSTTTTTPQIAICDASCNQTIVIDSSWDGQERYWATPGWYDMLDYPENCVCQLTVQILTTAEVSTNFDPLSVISGTPGSCEDDNVQYSTGSEKYCGSLFYVTQTTTNIAPENTTFTVTFTSSDGDGGDTGAGFELILSAIIFTVSTTTPAATTTAAPLGECDPSCNQTITVDENWDNDNFIWTSPGWPEGRNYPDNCICILTVQIVDSAIVTTSFNSSSFIVGTSGNCNEDNLQYSSNIDSTKYCEDDLQTLTQSVTNLSPANTVYTVTFTSTDQDGSQTDVGFALMLDVVLLTPSTTPAPPATTTIPTGVCDPSCNDTVVIDENYMDSTFTWNSPGWNEQRNYPDNCVCILNVQVVTTATIDINFNVSSLISGTPGTCDDGDNLEFTGDISPATYCGYLGFITQSVNNMAPNEKDFTFIFTSTDVDPTDVGFSLNLIVKVFTTTSTTATAAPTTAAPTTTTTTTTPEPTTTEDPSADCDPSCNVNIVVDKNWSADNFSWSSLGWDEGKNYPENCICTLTVEIETSATVTVNFNDSSVIAGTSGNCLGDHLYFSGNVDTTKYCDTDLGDLTQTVTNTAPGTTTFSVTFATTDTDGENDVGFLLNLQVTLISTTTSTTTSTSTTSTTSSTPPPTTSTSTTTSTTTTPASLGECGDCNKTLTITQETANGRYTWASPGWEDGENYPDGCCCMLFVNITTFSSVQMSFNQSSKIHAQDNCLYDHLDIDGTDLTTKTHCDTSIRDVQESIFQFQPGYKNFTVTFKTAVEPQGTTVDVGFILYVDVLIYTWDINRKEENKHLEYPQKI